MNSKAIGHTVLFSYSSLFNTLIINYHYMYIVIQIKLLTEAINYGSGPIYLWNNDIVEFSQFFSM